MELAPILVLGGVVVFLGLSVWLRLRQSDQPAPGNEGLAGLGFGAPGDAVLVAREHGELLHVNETARRWFHIDGGEPNLELLARAAQPPDTFLELFAAEKQASFQVGNLWVEASSHRIPAGQETRVVVIVRELTSSSANAEVLDLSQTMLVINDIGETVNVGLGIEQVLQALLSITLKAVPADAGEICLWDEETQTLVPRGWVGDVSYVFALSESGGAYHVGEGITGWIARHRKPVLVLDRDDERSVKPKLSDTPYQSFAAVPLAMGDRFIGTFELASRRVGGLREADLALLRAISRPVATAIYNAQLYGEQVRRVDDLASLQQVAQGQRPDRDAQKVYASLAEKIARLLSADICGILLYDEWRRSLIAEIPFHGLPNSLVQSYQVPLPEGSPQHAIFESHDHWVSNDLQDEPMVEALNLGTLVHAAGMYNSILMPLQVGGERIGLLQVGNKRTHGGFTPSDVQNLRILAAQAAVVVQNLRLYQTEQRIDTELAGLQEMTHAIGALSHEGEFFSDINTRIARLMNIEISAIFLYDPEENRLVSQPPYYGLDAALAPRLHVLLRPGTSFEHIWREENYWYSNRVTSDPIIHEAGLADILETAGVSKTIFAALTAGGRRVGMIQVANKTTGEDFTEKDARLLLIFATQAAAMIENQRLYREMQRRADEAESVRRVAELAGAIVTAEDSFQPVLAEIARLTKSPVVFMNTLSLDSGTLVTEPRNCYGVELAGRYVQDIYDKHFEASVAITRQPYVSNNLLTDPTVVPGYRKLAEEALFKRAVIVPLAVGDRSLGELGIANRPSPYGDEDPRLLAALAVQLAAALDRVRLNQATGENLSRRLQELDAISRVSNELNVTLDFDRIMDIIRHEAMQATEASGCSVTLIHSRAEWRLPDEPLFSRRIAERHTTARLMPPKLVPIEREAARGSDAVLVENYATSDLEAVPTGVRSAVAAAIVYADDPIGVIHLYHESANHFDQQAASFLVTLAAKASLGYANALRYQESLDRSARLRRRVEQLNQIFELGHVLQSNLDQDAMLEATAYSVQQSAGYDLVLVALVDEESGVVRRAVQAGLPLDQFERTKARTLKVSNLESLLNEQFRVSESYFLPLEKLAVWYTEGADVLAMTSEDNRSLHPRSKNDWRDGDMLLVPMHGADGRLLGVISLDRPFNNQRPDRGDVEILEIFAHQAAASLENMRLYQTTVRSAEQEARLNEVMEAVSSTLDVSEIIETVARGALRLVPFSRMTVALQDLDSASFDLVVGTVVTGDTVVMAHEGRTTLERTAMGRTFETHQDFLYHISDSQLAAYSDLRAWHIDGEQSSLIVPLLAGGSCLGAMHFGSNHKNTTAFEEHRALLKRLANLAAVAIQNARLFNQAVNLRLFNESVVESIQQGIAVLDRGGRIVSINTSMRDRFGWDDSALYRPLMEYQPNLIFLLEDLQAVLEDAEPRERINQRMQAPDGERVQNFYLYPLRSADAARGAVLLTDDVTDRAELEQDIAERAKQLATLTEASSRITATLNRAEIIELALDEMARILPYDSMTLWLRDEDLLTLEGGRGLDLMTTVTPQMDIDSNERVRRLVETQLPYAVDRLTGADSLPGEIGAQSWLGVPLIRAGEAIGMIALNKAQPAFYDTQSEQAAFAFANQVAVMLVNADLFTDAQSRAQRLSLLNRVSLSLAQSLDNENILEVALREISQLLHLETGRAYLVEGETKLARVIVEHPRGDFPPDLAVHIDENLILKYLSRTIQPLVIENVIRAAEEDPLVQQVAERGVTAFIGIPMAISGRAIGFFELEAFDGIRRVEPEQIDLALIVANQAAIAVQNASLLEQTLVRTRELETLLEAAQATSFTLDLEEVFENAARLTLQALDMDRCIITLHDPMHYALDVQIDLSRAEMPTSLAAGTPIPLKRYPARIQALESRRVAVIHRDDESADPMELDELYRLENHARMLVPLVTRDQSIGLMLIDVRGDHRQLTHRDMRMAQALAATAATAIENARLTSETAARVEELLIINDISRAIASTMDVESMVAIVREYVPQLIDADEIYLALVDPDTEHVTYPFVLNRGETATRAPHPLGDDETSYVVKNRRLLSLGGEFDFEEVQRMLHIVPANPAMVAYLGVPLIAGDVLLGVLALVNTNADKGSFGLNDQRILTTVASQFSASAQNARLFTQIRRFADELNIRVHERTVELQQERDQLDALYRITVELAQTLDMDRVLTTALGMVASAVRADDGVIMLLDPETGRLYSRASFLPLLDVNGQGARPTHPAERLGEWLMNNVGAVVIDDLHTLDYWEVDGASAREWHSALAVQLESNDAPLGAMVFLSRRTGVFSEQQLRLLAAAANQVAAAINNADLYNLIREQAERLGNLLRTEQEEAQKSAAIVESIADGVVLADARANIILFNAAAERILDLPRDVILGQPFTRLGARFTSANREWAYAVSDWAANPGGYHPDEFLVERLEIGHRVVTARLSPVFIGSQLLGTVAVFRDITRDVEVDRMKTEFISNVSHELRTPMTSIKGYADLLLMGAAGQVPETQRGFLETIKNNADRLATLVNDLLNISKLDSDKEHLELDDVDVTAVLRSVVAKLRVRPRFVEKNLTVNTEFAPELPVIRADRAHLTQIFTNIVDNAFNYTYAGGSIDVRAVLREDKPHILISVQDTGIGIPAEFQPRVFDRFERYDEHALVMDVAGTGLGLPIARHLVEMHHGEIWFESEVNEGSTFYVSLPIPQVTRATQEMNLAGDGQPAGIE